MSVLNDKDPAFVSRVALKAFFNIAKSWGLEPQEERIILGEPASATFEAWREGKGPLIPDETLKRISYILGIYKALRLLLQSEEHARTWIKSPNRAPTFGGVSALNVMLKGRVSDLADVRGYLDAMTA